MRSERTAALVLLFLGGCAASPSRHSVDASYMKNKSRSIAVLGVHVRGEGLDPARLQEALGARMRELGWTAAKPGAGPRLAGAWKEADGAEAAKKAGAEAALLCSVRIAPPDRHHDLRADPSVYASPSDPSGARREYYRKEEASGATDRGPAVRIEVAIVDAATGASTYVCEVWAGLKDVDEAGAAERILEPLEHIR